MDILKAIGRETELFSSDLSTFQYDLSDSVAEAKFLVIGGAGSIGQAVTKEIFARAPAVLILLILVKTIWWSW